MSMTAQKEMLGHVLQRLDAAETWEDIAAAVAAELRLRSVSGRELARRVGSPPATLARALKQGFARTRDRMLVERIDHCLVLQGRLAHAVEHLHGAAAGAGELFVHHFPARYVGHVWMRLVPTSKRVGHRHDVRVNWGPWEVLLPVRNPPAAGIVWWFTKGDDGLSVPIFVHVQPAAINEFTTVPRWGQDDAIDANRGWYRDDE